MIKVTQDEYIQYAINWCNEMKKLDLNKAHQVAIFGLNQEDKYDLVNTYIFNKLELPNKIKQLINYL